MSEKNHQTEDKYVVRFPDGMRDRIRDAAAANNRSMNAEIVARLEASFSQGETSMLVELDVVIQKLKWATAEGVRIENELARRVGAHDLIRPVPDE